MSSPASSSRNNDTVVASQLSHALHVLFHSSDHLQQAQANSWLLNFMQSTQGWNAALSLLSLASTSNDEMLLFAANTCYNKVKQDWNQLKEEDRRQLKQQLLSYIKHLSTSDTAKTRSIIIEKLAASIAILTLRSTQGPAAFMRQIIESIRQPERTASSAEYSLTVLRIISAIGDAALQLHLPYTRDQQLKQQLQQQVESVLILAGSSLLSSDYQQKVLALQCLRNWLPHGVTLVTLASSQLLQSILTLLNEVIKNILQQPQQQSGHSQQLLDSMVEILVEAIEARYSKEEELLSACIPIISLIFSLQSVIQQCYLTIKQQKASTSISTTLSLDSAALLLMQLSLLLDSICRANIEWLAAGSPEALQLVSLMLGFTRLPYDYHSISMNTWTFWIALNDIPVDSRHPQLRQAIFTEVVSALISQSAYPESFLGWEDSSSSFAGDRDAFLDYRRQLNEVLYCIFCLLQQSYLQQCLQIVQHANKSWAKLESAVNAVVAVSVELQESLKAEDEDVSSNQPSNSLNSIMMPLFAAFLDSLDSASHPVLISASCDLIRVYAFWLAEEASLLHSLLRFLLGATRITDEAGPAFSNLVSYSASTIAADVNLVNSLLNSMNTTSEWQAILPANQEHFLSGLAMIGLMLPTSLSSSYINTLIQSAIHSLQSSLQETTSSSASYGQILLALSKAYAQLTSIVSPHNERRTAANSNPLLKHSWQQSCLNIMQQHWPLITQSQQILLQLQSKLSMDENALQALCGFYVALINMASEEEQLEWLQPILSNTLLSYQLLPSAAPLNVIIKILESSFSQQSNFDHLINQFLPSVIKLTIHQTSSSLSSHTELLSEFWTLLYLLLTLPFPTLINNPPESLLEQILISGDQIIQQVQHNLCLQRVIQFYQYLLDKAFNSQRYKEKLSTLSNNKQQKDRQEAYQIANQEWRQSVQFLWQQHAKQTVDALLIILFNLSLAATHSVHSLFCDKAITFIQQLLSHYLESVWPSLTHHLHIKAQQQYWSHQDEERILSLLWYFLNDSRQWKALFNDVKLICYGQESLDVLIGYESKRQERTAMIEAKQKENESKQQQRVEGSSREHAIVL